LDGKFAIRGTRGTESGILPFETILQPEEGLCLAETLCCVNLRKYLWATEVVTVFIQNHIQLGE
jgi:hypothetical protein